MPALGDRSATSIRRRNGARLLCSAAISTAVLLGATSAFAQSAVAPGGPPASQGSAQPLAAGTTTPTSTASEQIPAQTGASDSPDTATIIVTARRRSENIQRVPTAITAFGAQQLAERGIRTQSDLQLTVPGLTLRQTEGQNQLTYSIRGQTVDAFTGSATAVVPYINEVQLNTGGAASFFDLDSIQVLKGPQGTLFGRNATGGAVLFTTAKPTNDFSGYIEGRVGNYALKEGQGAINIPIVSDKILLRAAFDIAARNGYIYDIYHDTKLGKTRRQSGRLSLTLKPTEGITNTTVFEYDHSGGNNTGASYLYSVNQCGQVNNGFPLNCAAQIYNPDNFNAAFGPGAWDAYLAANPKAFPGGINAFLADQKRRGLWSANTAANSLHREHDWFVNNTTTIDLGGETQLKNIFGVSHSYARDDAAETGDPFGIQFTDNLALGQFGNIVRTSQLSDELQLQGKAFDGNLQYIIGGYYQQTHSQIFYPQTYFVLTPFVPISGPTTDWKTRDRTEAVFAQGTYDLSSLTGLSGLGFTAGFRYTWEQISLVQLPDSNQYPGPNHQRVTFQDPSWEVGFEYQASPNLLTYIKTRGSFRAGGLNGSAPPIAADATGGGDEFHSEHTHDVEAGLKYSGQLMAHPAHFNIALYNQWISGVQRAEFPTVTDINGSSHSIAVTINVPAAVVRGIEAEGSVRPASWLEIGASGAYTHAKYTDNTTVLFGNTFVFGPYADTPKLSGTVYARLSIPTGPDIGDMSLRAEAYAQTHQYFSNTDATITPGTKLPGYALVNMRYDWNGIMGTGLSAGLFVKNMLNKGYFVGGLAEGLSLGVNAADVGEPRTYGLEVKYRF